MERPAEPPENEGNDGVSMESTNQCIYAAVCTARGLEIT